MTHSISLEQLSDQAPSLGLETHKSTLALEEAVKLKKQYAQTVKKWIETLDSLKTLSVCLATEEAQQMGRLGVLFANYSINQLCAGANIAVESLAIPRTEYEENPSNAIKAGLTNLTGLREKIAKQVKTAAAGVLLQHCQAREALVSPIVEMRADINAIKTQLSSDLPSTGVKQIQAWEGIEFLCYDRGGELPVFDTRALRSFTDLKALLQNHQRFVNDVVGQLKSWLVNNRAALLATPPSYDGIFINHKQFLQYFGDAINQLPGMYCAQVRVDDFGVIGKDAIATAQSIQFSLADYSEFGDHHADQLRKLVVKGNYRVGALSKNDASVLISKIEELFTDFTKWVEFSYSQVWEEADFDNFVYPMIERTTQDGASSAVGAIACAMLAQLSNASDSLQVYSLHVLRSMLSYVQTSLTETST